MNFSKNPFINANKVSKTNSRITTSRTSVNDIRDNMINTNFNSNELNKQIVKQKDQEHQQRQENLANSYSQYSNSNLQTRQNNINAQNNIIRGNRFGS